MSDAAPPTADQRIAAAQARRERLRAEQEAALKEQQATDLEALADLEAEHGFDRVLRIDLVGWKPGVGAAALLAVRVPEGRESVVKRFEQTVATSKERTPTNLQALKTLGEACVVYPDRKSQRDLYDATLELAPAILSKAGELVIKAVQGRGEEEKKD